MAALGRESRSELEAEMKQFGLSDDAVRLLDDGPGWVTLFRDGHIAEAYSQLCRGGRLPEMLSHIRSDPMEPVDLPLRQLQYMVAWTARDRGLTGVHVPDKGSGQRIAVVGGGPAGLAGTVRLLEQGHAVSLIEREKKLGGAPALVYCDDRLPDPSDEIEALLKPAMRSGRLTITLGRAGVPEELLTSHDAVLMATGCWNEPSLGSAEGVWSALSFLKAVREGDCRQVPATVTVLCGGDAAMDAAVCAHRLGAERLILLFSSSREEAHWHMPASWFDTVGADVGYEFRAVGYRVDDQGAVCGVELEGDGCVETAMVIEAMGLQADPVPEQPRLFMAGALANGGASVQQCMAEGERAANAISRFLAEAVS